MKLLIVLVSNLLDDYNVRSIFKLKLNANTVQIMESYYYALQRAFNFNYDVKRSIYKSMFPAFYIYGQLLAEERLFLKTIDYLNLISDN
jgi:hypothetical protein